MRGSAYVALGRLFIICPIPFADGNAAKEMLKTTLKTNPEGIDANYYYCSIISPMMRLAISKGQLPPDSH